MNLYGSQGAASMESLPYEKFVQRLLGRKEEAGQDEGFSVPTSQWLLFLQRSGW
jgi:hypothetical protein